jgi:hypothetical protein
MKPTRKIIVLGYVLSLGLTLIAFQNCSRVSFQSLQNTLTLKSTSEGGNGEPYDGKLVTISHLPTVIDSRSMSSVTLDGTCSDMSALELKLSGILIGTPACSAGVGGVNGTWALVFDSSSFADGKLTLEITRVGATEVLASAMIAKVTAQNMNLKVSGPPGANMRLPTLVGGNPPFSYSSVSGKGGVSSTGDYLAPAKAELTGLEAIDAQGKSFVFAVDFAPTVVNGPIDALAAFGDDLYLGGMFTAHRPYYTPGFVMIDKASGQIINSACNFFQGFGSDVVSMTANSTHIFISTTRTTYEGQPIQGLIKVSISDCSLDKTFTLTTGFNQPPLALLLDGNELFVGGEFATYRGASMVGLAKLDVVTGNPDPLFQMGAGFNAGARVDFLVADGNHVYPAGYFFNYQGVVTPSLAKISKSSGALDVAFSAGGGLSSLPTAVHLSDGFLYVAVDYSPSYRGVAFGGLAKIDTTTGALDTTFSQALGFGFTLLSTRVNSIDSDATHVYVGGGFIGYRGVGVRYLAKLSKTDGSVDTSFTSATVMPNSDVNHILRDGNRLLVAGNLTSYRGVSVDSLMAVSLVDGSVVYGGGASAGLYRSRNGMLGVTRLVSNGSALLLTGRFDFYGGVRTGTLAKVKASDYSLDPQFHSGQAFGVQVLGLKFINESLYVVSAASTPVSYRGTSVTGVFKVNGVSGQLDTVFSQANNTNGRVVAVETDGTSLYIGGWFSQYRGASAARVAKVDLVTGAMDSAFNVGSGANSTVEIIKHINGGLYVGGQFQTFNGVNTGSLAKLSPQTGAVDLVFNSAPGFSVPSSISTISSLTLVGSDLVVSGTFMQYRGNAISSGVLQINSVNGSPTPGGMSASVFGNSPITTVKLGESVVFSFNPFSAPTFRGASVPALISVDATTGEINSQFSAQVGSGHNDFSKIELQGGAIYLMGRFTKFGDSWRSCLLRIDPVTGKLD